MEKLTYISLFSSAGVGCYGLKMNGFECIITNELIERRLNIQKFNNKCKYDSGYILGAIETKEVQDKIYNEINFWKNKEKIKDITVIMATPPCQGMSIANHKKNDNEIKRNSLVIESIKIISKVQPKFFILENVPTFMKTSCTDIDEIDKPIENAINNNLGKLYSITSQILNFKNYGACSSRPRTLVIGVRNDLADFISPIELFPNICNEKTLRDTIGHLKPLTMFGEIDKNDIYHSFRIYPEHMRNWIHDLKEGESAFDNTDINKIPHRVIDGKIVINKKKNADKYTRQYWDKVGPCIHTRNDQLASQNTIHPFDDRVFSIRELMLMMTIPNSFKWTNISLETLNSLSDTQKRAFLKKEEMNIRQCIGEAVPTTIIDSISKKICFFLSKQPLKTTEINKIISDNNLTNYSNLKKFVLKYIDMYDYYTMSKIIELSNSMRMKNSAYFTDKSIINQIINQIPQFDGDIIHILEPSVGTGNFIPFLIKKFECKKNIIIDVVDIDKNILDLLKILLKHLKIPNKVTINFINDDFLTHDFNIKYDLIIGNPPFTKLKSKDIKLAIYLEKNINKQSTNLFEFFLEKCIKLGNYISLITPKSLLNTPEFKDTRSLLENFKITSIIDFGENGFKNVLVETICINIEPNKNPNFVNVISVPKNINIIQEQKYICDNQYPYWIIYRNQFFDNVANSLIFNIFTVFRDRQITNSMLCSEPYNNIRVLKSRNIDDSGENIIDISSYDTYINIDTASRLNVFKYINNDNVYITPNMTYKPRMIKKPLNTLTNGSIAILIPKSNINITKKDMLYFSSKEYRQFYQIARNFQTRSLNVDSYSVFFFGIRKDNKI